MLEFLGNATNYYLISFSDQRMDATRQRMRALSAKYALTESATKRLEDLTAHQPDRDQFQKTAWLFASVKKRIIEDGTLDENVKSVLLRCDTPISRTEVKRLCCNSKSAWDVFVRNLTPELPQTLADFVLVDLIPSAQLHEILARLTLPESKLLREKFTVIAKEVTGANRDWYWPTIS